MFSGVFAVVGFVGDRVVVLDLLIVWLIVLVSSLVGCRFGGVCSLVLLYLIPCCLVVWLFGLVLSVVCFVCCV